MSDGVKRPYRSPLRTSAAARTRRQVREAGHRLFVANGFVTTSMKAVGAEAGVSERTVYTHFRNKVELYQEALNVAVAGDEEPVALADRHEYAELVRTPDADELIDSMTTWGAELHARAGALIMAGVESAGADPDMRRIAVEGEAAMRSNIGDMAAALMATGRVRPEYDEAAVTNILFTLSSPHVFQLMGWPADRYQAWLATTLKSSLLL